MTAGACERLSSAIGRLTRLYDGKKKENFSEQTKIWKEILVTGNVAKLNAIIHETCNLLGIIGGVVNFFW